MTAQADLFDLQKGKELRDEDMAVAAASNYSDLELGRIIAFRIANAKGTVTADDVGEALYDEHGIKTLGHSAGSLFKRSIFEDTGERVSSKRKKNHASEIKVWRLKR